MEALIEAKREMNHEPKMEGLLMIERNIEGKLSLLLDVVYFGDMALQRTFFIIIIYLSNINFTRNG